MIAMITGSLFLGAVGIVFLIFLVVIVSNYIEICQPNEVLVFSGGFGKNYQVLNSGRKVRIPIFQTVDRIDVTNMVIDVSCSNAYSKGGIPLSIKGVANVKIGSQAPYVDNAIERFLGTPRGELQQVVKETLEGNLRGVLSTLTPEEVNDNRTLFAQSLLEEAEHDLTKLGLVLDNLKIQSVTDEQGFLDSIGRKQSAGLLMTSRIAEADNQADATVRDAENQLQAALARIHADKSIAKADADRRVLDAQTKGEAMVAEQRSGVGSLIAKARASIDVQQARIEQVKRQLAADVIQPAQARKAELEAEAKGDAATIIEDGKANVTALQALLETWQHAGTAARPTFLMQQFDALVDNMLSTVGDLRIAKITVIDSDLKALDESGSMPMRAASGAEQIKETMGVDVAGLVKGLSGLSSS
jgi:flotillin